jgi:hypothetical protein
VDEYGNEIKLRGVHVGFMTSRKGPMELEDLKQLKDIGLNVIDMGAWWGDTSDKLPSELNEMDPGVKKD